MNLPGNIASEAIYPVVAIPNPPGTNAFTDPFGVVRSTNALAVAEAILNLGGGLQPGEPINIIAHSDANQAIVEKLVIALRTLNPNATIEVGRLDPTGVFKPSFLLCNTYDIGSNKRLSLDPRDLAALLWGLISPPDYRANPGVSHMDLLNNQDVLRKLQSQFLF